MLDDLRNQARKLKNQLTAVYYASQDHRVGMMPKVLVAVAIAYTLSPIDLIPDFIPVLGLLDDLIIVPALLGLAIRLIPSEVMDDARRRAEEAPLRLTKNWVAGAVFIAIWLAVLGWAGLWILSLFSGS